MGDGAGKKGRKKKEETNHVRDGTLMVSPFLHGEPFEQNEAFAVNQVFPQDG